MMVRSTPRAVFATRKYAIVCVLCVKESNDFTFVFDSLALELKWTLELFPQTSIVDFDYAMVDVGVFKQSYGDGEWYKSLFKSK